MASPASDPPQSDADLLVCHQAVRKKGKLLRTYVLVNYRHRKKLTSSDGVEVEFMSSLYRHDLLEGTASSRISAIVHFSAPYAEGITCAAFFYPDEEWGEYSDGFSEPLNQFIRNFVPV